MTAPVASAGMLIRRPISDVFHAFMDPAVTTRFWFSKSSGALVPGAALRWDWEMYGVGTDVQVKSIKEDHSILIDWDNRSNPTEVEWRFVPRNDGTWVTIENRGFADNAEGMAGALDASGGFALVLAGAKIWLEHGTEARFVFDRHPDARVDR